MNNFSDTKLILTEEVGESIEMTYIETSNNVLAVYPAPPPARRVFKIVYSCKGGKWHKSEPVYGTINPSVKESYTF